MAENDDDDLSLFRSEMADVVPLKPQNRVTQRNPADRKPVRRDHADDVDAIEDVFSDTRGDGDCPDTLAFSRSGLQHRVLRQLRAGRYPVEDVLDLHGLKVEDARRELLQFLSGCQMNGVRSVLIIHGKGYRSREKPVIKPMVNRWLRATDRVLAFHSAQPKDGGTGAVYVLLKA